MIATCRRTRYLPRTCIVGRSVRSHCGLSWDVRRHVQYTTSAGVSGRFSAKGLGEVKLPPLVGPSSHVHNVREPPLQFKTVGRTPPPRLKILTNQPCSECWAKFKPVPSVLNVCCQLGQGGSVGLLWRPAHHASRAAVCRFERKVRRGREDVKPHDDTDRPACSRDCRMLLTA